MIRLTPGQIFMIASSAFAALPAAASTDIDLTVNAYVTRRAKEVPKNLHVQICALAKFKKGRQRLGVDRAHCKRAVTNEYGQILNLVLRVRSTQSDDTPLSYTFTIDPAGKEAPVSHQKVDVFGIDCSGWFQPCHQTANVWFFLSGIESAPDKTRGPPSIIIPSPHKKGSAPAGKR